MQSKHEKELARLVVSYRVEERVFNENLTFYTLFIGNRVSPVVESCHRTLLFMFSLHDIYSGELRLTQEEINTIKYPAKIVCPTCRALVGVQCSVRKPGNVERVDWFHRSRIEQAEKEGHAEERNE